MQNENNLDQYLRDKVENADFDFKEEYWNQAAQMLDEEDRKKRRPIFWRWFAVVGTLLVVTIGTYLFSNKNNNNKKDKSPIAKTETTQNTPQTNKSYVIDGPEQAANQNAENAPVNTPNEVPVEKNNISEKNTGGTINNKKEPQQPKDDNNSPVADKNPIANQKSDQNKGAIQNQNIPSKITPDKKEKTKKDKKKDRKKQVQNLENQQDIAKPNQKKDNTVWIKGKELLPKDTQVIAARQPIDPDISNPRYNALLRDYVAVRDTTVYTYTPVPPAVAVVPKPQINTDTAATKRKNGFTFYVSGGANFNKGFKGNATTAIAWGFAPYLNGGFEKEINPKISIASQIGFTYFNALNIQKKVVQYKYSFGYDSTKITVDYHKMYQIVLPVSMAYHLNKLHTIMGGIGASYVLNTSSKVTNNKQVSYQTGYTDGINPLDIFAQLGYQYQLNNKFAFMGFFQQGFMNATKKDYFNITTQNTQTRISLGLKYYFKRNGQ